MMKKIILILLYVIPICSMGQSLDQNYVKTTTYRTPLSTVSQNPSSSDVSIQVMYYDGLGRPLQKISHAQAGDGNSIITPMKYDAFGRAEKEFLPYTVDNSTMDFQTNSNTAQFDYYNDGNMTVTGNPYFDITSNAYSKKLFENSPLNRVLAQAAPGDDWMLGNGHEVRFNYGTNIAGEVKLYTVNMNIDATGIYLCDIIDAGYYLPGRLYKTVSKDENWVSGFNHTVEEFKDMDGKTVLKRTYESGIAHDTHYVYDKYGNLSFVMPPLANGNIDSLTLSGLCYQYRYDHRNRLAEKKLPGKDWEYIFYDILDRPVVTGPVLDPFGRSIIGFIVTKYDAFDRVCFTGWFPSANTPSVITNLRNYYNDPTHVDNAVRDNTTPIENVNVGYRYNLNLPIKFELLTITYYDDYNFPGNPGTLPVDVLGQALIVSPKRFVTGMWRRILTDEDVESGDISYTLYDKKGRVVRDFTTEQVNGYTDISNLYNFVGELRYSKTMHKKPSSAAVLTLQENFKYDNGGRLTSHGHKINSKDPEMLSENSYDHLGMLISKYVGGTEGAPLQEVNYRYNVRGWLTNINDDQMLADDLFAFRINYNRPLNAAFSVHSLYNGNISETAWRTSSDNLLRMYSYDYDGLNRLYEAMYQKMGTSILMGNYNEVLEYDMNGNIVHLNRTGALDNSTMNVMIDDLSYEYDADNPNQLRKVTDSTNSQRGFKDDSDGTNDTDPDYDYDSLGNLIKDQNKGIANIYYNHLNLPYSIEFGSGEKITYIYDAMGGKMKKLVFDGTQTTTIDYMSGFQYKNGVLQFFPTTEGYVAYTSSPDVPADLAYNYVYSYKDHLGNIRLNYSRDPSDNILKILEENHYYPFGLKHENYSSDVKKYTKEVAEPLAIKPIPVLSRIEYNYKYNGKEFQDELGLNFYDYGARNYDPAIGRWMNIDPLAEIAEEDSPYAYAHNNPVIYVDPTGMSATQYVDEDGNEILNTNDGSKDVVTVSKEKEKDFKELVKYTSTNMSDSKAWNDNMKADMLGFDSVDKMENLLGGFSTQWSRQNAIDYIQNPTFGNAMAMAYSEALSQWTDPNKVVGAASGAIMAFRPRPNPGGIIYLRTDLSGGLKPYVGQAKNEARYISRQAEHARANPNADFQFKVIDRGSAKGNFPTSLDVKEQQALNKLNGPTNKSNVNGGASNKKNVIKQ